MKAARFETRFTAEFICRFLPRRDERILEVGCGAGELAAHLSKLGFRVTAIDSDEESIASARLLGVDAQVANWPDFSSGSFDAVLFTRSLHHIHPLRGAVETAAGCLQAGGHIIVEDFAYEAADERTLRWFVSASRIIAAAGLLIKSHEFLDEMLATDGSLAAWHKHHDHDLSNAAQIAAALETVCDNVIAENVPYFFRYLTNAMDSLDQRNAVTEALAQQESELISQGAIIALGRRYVATRDVGAQRSNSVIKPEGAA